MPHIHHTHTAAPDRKIEIASARAFGFAFAAVFGILAMAPWISGGELSIWAGTITIILLAATFLRPTLLTPLNRIWLRIGMALHYVVTPVAMAILFFLIVSPFAIVMRVLRKENPLRLTRNGRADSYWIDRQPKGPAPNSMKNQF